MELEESLKTLSKVASPTGEFLRTSNMLTISMQHQLVSHCTVFTISLLVRCISLQVNFM